MGAVTGATVSWLNHVMHKALAPKKINYKRLFATLKSHSLFSRATDLIAFGITGRYRHLFGPDAVALSINANASVGAVAKVEGGVLLVLDGVDSGKSYLYQDFGIGAGMASAAINVSVTSLYYSGTGSFKHDVFLGLRYEANVGADFGVGIGLTGIYAPLTGGEFVIGFGTSVGLGISATIIDGNLNLGQTSRTTPWKK